MSQQEKDVQRFNYQIYGLRVQANLPIPALLPAGTPGCPDLQITFLESENYPQPEDSTAIYSSSVATRAGAPYFRVWRSDNNKPAFLGIQYNDGQGSATFLVDRLGQKAAIYKTKTLPIADVLTYLLGPVTGCILRLRQETCLHAGVIAVDDRSLAVIGPKGSGKSTLIASLAQAGCAVLSDDIAPLTEDDGRFFVMPGYPCLRLWPDTINSLTGLNAADLTRILTISEKRFFPLKLGANSGPWRFQPTPLPLGAIYLIAGRNEQETSIRRQSQAAGLITLTGNCYPEYSLRPSDRARDFPVLARLASAVPIFELSGMDGITNLPKIRDAILAELKFLG